MEEFFGVVGVVDFGWCGAVGPGQPAGDGGLVVAVGDVFVVGGAGEEQLVGIGGAVRCPVRAVVHFAVISGR